MRDRTYLPLLLDITDKKILILGAGKAASEKLRTLSQLGKKITVIAPEIRPEFQDKEWIQIECRKYRQGDLKGYQIVYAGVNDPTVEESIHQEAKQEGVLLNIIDHVERSDFISPSALIKKYFAIFISTFGKGPGMTKRIRQLLETSLDLDAIDREAEEYIVQRERAKQEKSK